MVFIVSIAEVKKHYGNYNTPVRRLTVFSMIDLHCLTHKVPCLSPAYGGDLVGDIARPKILDDRQ